MSLIDLPTAKAHLRVEDDYPDAQVSIYLNAAEKAASEFLNRAIFADQNALNTAVSAIPAILTAGRAAYDDALEAADLIEDPLASSAAKEYAWRVYRNLQIKTDETYCGIVIDALIEAGILLILGQLFFTREDQARASLPKDSQDLLMPYRVGMGV